MATCGNSSSGPDAVVLKNEYLRVSIVPAAGGKIFDVVDAKTGFNLLWHNPRVRLQETRAGAPFDDTWAGGWDDLFPTDIACAYGDNTFPDHGDLWSGPWTMDSCDSDQPIHTLSMWRDSVCLPVRARKTLVLDHTGPAVHVHYELENHGPHTVFFMFNQHIAHAIGPGSRVHMPAKRLAVEPPTSSRAGSVAEVHWPSHPGVGDLSYLPGPEAGVTEFLYATDLSGGWIVVTHPTHGVASRLEFDPQVFPTPWLWGVFGGWRGHHLLLTEPCTSRPGSLASAVENGTASHLAPRASLTTTVTLAVAHDFNLEAPGDVDPTTR